LRICRCADVQMCGCADVQMCRCVNVQMRELKSSHAVRLSGGSAPHHKGSPAIVNQYIGDRSRGDLSCVDLAREVLKQVQHDLKYIFGTCNVISSSAHLHICTSKHICTSTKSPLQYPPAHLLPLCRFFCAGAVWIF
jgi:hypothetical protein